MNLRIQQEENLNMFMKVIVNRMKEKKAKNIADEVKMVVAKYGLGYLQWGKYDLQRI